MDTTPNLQLPYLIASQAQKHVTHNEAIRALDALVQLGIKDRNLTAPPASPIDGDRYIIAASATGDWTGHDLKIAAYQDNAWMYYTPQEGWLCWVQDEAILVVWNGTDWIVASSGGGGGTTNLNPADGGLVGINATADITNRLAISSPASLFNHEGNGHQLKINKALVGDTASTLFQTGFSGRAEFGTTGDDDFHMKVSPDGANWFEGIIIDKDTGAVSFPNTTIGGGGASVPVIKQITASGNYTKPAGLVYIKIRGISGGGGGGGVPLSVTGTSSGGGGGSAGSFFEKTIPAADLDPTTACTIGAGGLGGGPSGEGFPGGDTSFGTHATAPGGGAGQSGVNSSTNFTARFGGAATAGTGGDINASGASGSAGLRNENIGIRGAGGSSPFGGGGAGGPSAPGTSTVNNGTGNGAGGSGASTSSGGPALDGGVGTAGIIIIEEYF